MQSSLNIFGGETVEKYQIGNVDIIWKGEQISLHMDDFMKCFQTDVDTNLLDTIIYESKFLNIEDYTKEKLLKKTSQFELYETEEGKVIIYRWGSLRYAYGFKLSELEKGDNIVCYFNKDILQEKPLDASKFLSSAGLHSKLLQKGAVILHASYIDWNGKAILFAGRSGVGKSTQADLWAEHERAEIINGDRTLLRKRDGRWHAYGYPCCGSSKICVNRTLPLAAIVLLQHGDKNEIMDISIAQKYQALVAGSEMYLWDEKELETVSQIAGEILTDIPVIKYSCRPDKEAVSVLKQKLEEYL